MEKAAFLMDNSTVSPLINSAHVGLFITNYLERQRLEQAGGKIGE